MTNQAAASEPLSGTDLQAVLDEAPARVWWRRTIVWSLVALLALTAAGVYLWQMNARNNAAPVFVTEPVNRGKLTLTVAANGTLQPTRSVSIGSELSGTVLRVMVDVNDTSRKARCWWSSTPPN